MDLKFLEALLRARTGRLLCQIGQELWVWGYYGRLGKRLHSMGRRMLNIQIPEAQVWVFERDDLPDGHWHWTPKTLEAVN